MLIDFKALNNIDNNSNNTYKIRSFLPDIMLNIIIDNSLILTKGSSLDSSIIVAFNNLIRVSITHVVLANFNKISRDRTASNNLYLKLLLIKTNKTLCKVSQLLGLTK